MVTTAFSKMPSRSCEVTDKSAFQVPETDPHDPNVMDLMSDREALIGRLRARIVRIEDLIERRESIVNGLRTKQANWQSRADRARDRIQRLECDRQAVDFHSSPDFEQLNKIASDSQQKIESAAQRAQRINETIKKLRRRRSQIKRRMHEWQDHISELIQKISPENESRQCGQAEMLSSVPDLIRRSQLLTLQHATGGDHMCRQDVLNEAGLDAVFELVGAGLWTAI